MSHEVWRNFIDKDISANYGIFFDEDEYTPRQRTLAYHFLKSIIVHSRGVRLGSAVQELISKPLIQDLFQENRDTSEMQKVREDLEIASEWVRSELKSKNLITEIGPKYGIITFESDDKSVAEKWDMLIGFAHSAKVDESEMIMCEIASSEARARGVV